ncbi:MAG: FAD-binding oxidoreductase [Saprospiraceae bacterium]|nr:FAD-binding oxidoreductase [Saprospiraceae bacterium]
MNYSFWEKKNIEDLYDVTIIGSGITGLSTAISIKEAAPNLTVKIIERGANPNGASTKNAGFSCFGSVSEILDDIDQFGSERTQEIIQMRWNGLSILKSRLTKEQMEYSNCGGVEAFRTKDKDLWDICHDRLDEANALFETITFEKQTWQWRKSSINHEFFNTELYNPLEGKLNPQSMMRELTKMAIQLGVDIFYGIEVEDVSFDEKILYCKGDVQISYQKLVICTNGFTKRILPDLDIVPARNQVLMTKPLRGLKLENTYHIDRGYLYFRTYQDRILLGGGRNMDVDGETTDAFGLTDDIQQYLIRFLESIFPGASQHIGMWWSGILGVGTSKIPIVKWVGEEVLCGVRLGGMGVAIGSYLGKKLSEEILKTHR